MISTKANLLALILSISCIASGQAVDSVIAKYIAFTGGEARWKTVQSIVSSGTYNYGGIEFPFTVYSKRPDRYKIVVPFKAKYFAQAFDGAKGWKIDAFKGETHKTILTGKPARAMANEAEVELENSFINYREKGYALRLEGIDTIDGIECFNVQLLKENEASENYFFNSRTYALVKKTAVSKNAELENALLDIFYSDYRTVNGLHLPFKIVHKANEQVILIITTDRVDLNKPVADAIFKP